MRVKIGRETELGLGFNTSVVDTNEGSMIPVPNKPIFTGSIYGVLAQLRQDANVRSLSSVDKTSSWFVKTGETWSRITKNADAMYDLIRKFPDDWPLLVGDTGFVVDEVWVEIETDLPPQVIDYMRILGSMRTEKKAMSSRENGKKGGRPKKQKRSGPESQKNTRE